MEVLTCVTHSTIASCGAKLLRFRASIVGSSAKLLEVWLSPPCPSDRHWTSQNIPESRHRIVSTSSCRLTLVNHGQCQSASRYEDGDLKTTAIKSGIHRKRWPNPANPGQSILLKYGLTIRFGQCEGKSSHASEMTNFRFVGTSRKTDCSPSAQVTVMESTENGFRDQSEFSRSTGTKSKPTGHPTGPSGVTCFDFNSCTSPALLPLLSSKRTSIKLEPSRFIINFQLGRQLGSQQHPKPSRLRSAVTADRLFFKKYQPKTLQ